jgi:hypothetical protein
VMPTPLHAFPLGTDKRQPTSSPSCVYRRRPVTRTRRYAGRPVD